MAEVRTPIEGIHFDYDGTIADSKRFQHLWLKYAAENFNGHKNIPEYSQEWQEGYNRAYCEANMPGLYAYVGVDFHASEKEIWKQYNEFNRTQPAPTIPGVKEAIVEIFERSRVRRYKGYVLRLAINTTKTWDDIDVSLKNADLLRYFDTVITKDKIYDYVTNGEQKRLNIAFDDYAALRTILPEQTVKSLEKPNSWASFLSILGLGVEAERTIAFEDTKVGIEAYRKVPGLRRPVDVYTVGVTWGYENKLDLIAAGADAIIDDPKQMVELVGDLGGFS